MSSYSEINWVTEGKNLIDYRPAIGPDGQSVIFERHFINPVVPVRLFMVSSLKNNDPVAFLPQPNNPQTRPDWCWQTNTVAFNVSQQVTNPDTGKVIEVINVWTVNTNTPDQPVSLLKQTNGFIYPQWNLAGTSLAVMNNGSGNISPCTSVTDADGNMAITNINGSDSNGNEVYGGMPAVNPTGNNLVAFAGQPVLANWNGGQDEPSYSQDNNYIFLNNLDVNNGYTCAPMETKAPITAFDPNFQGRAPAYSPDGRYIVFESTRINGDFALFLFDTQGDGVPVQLTDEAFQAQHAKFFPDGTKLIFCAKPTPETNNRIAWIDISAYL